MSIPDDWQPPPCKHGAQPIVEQEFMDWNNGFYMEKMPTRKSLWYDCSTPLECVREQYRSAEDAQLAADTLRATHQRLYGSGQHTPP